MMIQGVHVIVLKKEGNNAFVNNVDAGDIILTTPLASLSDLKRRFLKKIIFEIKELPD